MEEAGIMGLQSTFLVKKALASEPVLDGSIVPGSIGMGR